LGNLPHKGFAMKITFALLLVFASTAVGRAEDSLPELVKKVQPAVVTVVSYNPAKAMPSLGTGFFVAADRIVTARHVIGVANRAELRTAAGATLRVLGILAEDRPRDLVLVQVTKPGGPVAILPIAARQPELGERLFTVASPLGLEFSVSAGVASAFRDVADSGTVVQHTVQISAGSSGGPLLNFRGEVVAIQTGMITEGKRTISAGQGLNFAVLSRYVTPLKAAKLRPLEQTAKDLPAEWVPPITANIDRVSLYPLTRDDFPASLAFFEEATRREPQEPDAWFRLGLCQEKCGKPKQSRESYLKAISLRPGFGLALNNLGAVYNGLGKYDAAIDVLERAVKSDDKLLDAHASLAFAFYHLAKYPQAAAAADRALKLNSNHGNSLYYLALSCQHMGQKKRAGQQLDYLRKIDPKKADELQAAMKAAK
jgi:Tfp pilus assembly protein PilF